MLSRVGDVHGHATRAARSGLFVSTRDHRAVGYRVPREWGSMTEAERGAPSLESISGSAQEGVAGGLPGGVWVVCLWGRWLWVLRS